MHYAKYRLPLTAAALAVLLGACGGGGSDDAGTTVKDSAASTSTIAGNDAQLLSFGDVSLTTKAATVAQPLAQVAPISAAGVRGDALLTMLDQKPCLGMFQATSHDGTIVPAEQRTLPRSMRGELMLDPFNYKQLGPDINSLIVFKANGTCSPSFFQYQPAAEGTHRLNVYTEAPYRYIYTNDSYESDQQKFRRSSLNIPLTVTADGASLGATLTMAAGMTSEHLSSGTDFSFRNSAQISWGVLNYWYAGDSYVRMILLPGDQEGQARLCWNPSNADVKRLYCTLWQAPADWKRGEKLTTVEQYVVDDRSTYAGESGFLYARSFAP